MRSAECVGSCGETPHTTPFPPWKGIFCYTQTMTPKIVQEGTPVLRDIAAEVPADLFNTPKLAKMLKDMETALDEAPHGVAIAAPQIALPYRIFLIRYDRMIPEAEEETEKRPPELGVFINPEIIKTSRKQALVPEGCLSVDGVYGTTERFERATVRAQDATGKWFERGGGGILAQAFQHEIEHLNGILFIDHADNLEKNES